MMNDALDMRSHMGCATPDSGSSPGAHWLADVAAKVSESWDHGDFEDGKYDEMGLIAELADAAVPVYDHERWQVFVDLCAYNDESVEDIASDRSMDLTEVAGVILCRMAERGMAAWLSEARQQQADDDWAAE